MARTMREAAFGTGRANPGRGNRGQPRVNMMDKPRRAGDVHRDRWRRRRGDADLGRGRHGGALCDAPPGTRHGRLEQGAPVELFLPSDGTGAREAWRRFLS